jgi:DNA-directed RNA polymerase specialized sigma24 family protein
MEMDGAPDSELLSRAADGSDSAFATLVDRYAPPLYDFAARLTRDRDEAFEVVRETFLVALRDIRTHDVIQHPRPWLFSLARANILAIVDGSPRASHMLEGRGQDAEALDRVEASRLQPETDLAVANAMAPIAWESAAMLETRQLGILLLLLRERLPAEQAVEVFGIRPQNAAVIRPRIERAAEDNAWALFVLRDPSRRCPGLDAMLGSDSGPLTPVTRRAISRHTASCPLCGDTRASLPRFTAVLSALAPVEMPPADAASLRDGLLAEFAAAQPPPPLPPPPIALLPSPGPRWPRVLAAFAGLACVAGLLGGLLLVPASPIALTRDRATRDAPIVVIPADATPHIIFVTPTPGPPTASPTPPPSATPSSVAATHPGAGGATPVHQATEAASPSPTPTRTATATRTPPVTPTLTPPSPTPDGTECTPSLSTNVRQVNVTGGSSSFTVFNSFCRAVQYSLNVATGSSWLQLQQQFGTLQPGEFATIGLTVDKAALPEGVTTGALSLTWVDGSLTIPVSVTVSGGAPIVGPVQATCGPKNQANFFTARVIDDYGVKTVSLTVVAAGGDSTVIPMTLASGDAQAGSWTAEPTGPITSYSIAAIDAAGHTGVYPGTCTTSE